MRLAVSKPSGFETATDEAPRGGIGFRLKVTSCDQVEEGGGHRGGLGMNSSAKISATTTMMGMFAQKETPGGSSEKRWNEDGHDEGEMSRKPKKKGKRRAKVTGD